MLKITRVDIGQLDRCNDKFSAILQPFASDLYVLPSLTLFRSIVTDSDKLKDLLNSTISVNKPYVINSMTDYMRSAFIMALILDVFGWLKFDQMTDQVNDSKTGGKLLKLTGLINSCIETDKLYQDHIKARIKIDQKQGYLLVALLKLVRYLEIYCSGKELDSIVESAVNMQIIGMLGRIDQNPSEFYLTELNCIKNIEFKVCEVDLVGVKDSCHFVSAGFGNQFKVTAFTKAGLDEKFTTLMEFKDRFKKVWPANHHFLLVEEYYCQSIVTNKAGQPVQEHISSLKPSNQNNQLATGTSYHLSTIIAKSAGYEESYGKQAKLYSTGEPVEAATFITVVFISKLPVAKSQMITSDCKIFSVHTGLTYQDALHKIADCLSQLGCTSEFLNAPRTAHSLANISKRWLPIVNYEASHKQLVGQVFSKHCKRIADYFRIVDLSVSIGRIPQEVSITNIDTVQDLATQFSAKKPNLLSTTQRYVKLHVSFGLSNQLTLPMSSALKSSIMSTLLSPEGFTVLSLTINDECLINYAGHTSLTGRMPLFSHTAGSIEIDIRSVSHPRSISIYLS